jgi:hypothetical protein
LVSGGAGLVANISSSTMLARRTKALQAPCRCPRAVLESIVLR